jgi:hypothetical protein
LKGLHWLISPSFPSNAGEAWKPQQLVRLSVFLFSSLQPPARHHRVNADAPFVLLFCRFLTPTALSLRSSSTTTNKRGTTTDWLLLSHRKQPSLALCDGRARGYVHNSCSSLLLPPSRPFNHCHIPQPLPTMAS